MKIAKAPKPSLPELEYTAQRLAAIHKMLSEGLFPGKSCIAVAEAMHFIDELHKGVAKDLPKKEDAIVEG